MGHDERSCFVDSRTWELDCSWSSLVGFASLWSSALLACYSCGNSVFSQLRVAAAYLAVENRMKGEESEKACEDAHKPAMAAATDRRIVFVCCFVVSLGWNQNGAFVRCNEGGRRVPRGSFR